MLHSVFILLATLLIILTVLPLTRLRQWWVRACDFPRLQILVALAGILIWFLVWHLTASPVSMTGDTGSTASAPPSLLWALPLLGCFAWQALWIWPYSELHAQEVLGAVSWERRGMPRLRVLTSNVLMDNRDASALIEHVRREQPDLLVALETDDWWQSQLDQLDDYPHRIACPLDNRYGMHVYSRLPLAEATIDYLVEDDVPSIGAFIELPGDHRVRLHVVHPTPPAPGENVRSTERDVELVILARHLEGCTDPIVVTGDLNDVAWSATTRLFRKRSGLLDPRVGRGMYNTFHAEHRFVRWPLDHTFVSPHFRLIEARRLAYVGSDHFPVLFDLALSTDLELDSHLDKADIDEALEEDTMNTEVAQDAGTPSLGHPTS